MNKGGKQAHIIGLMGEQIALAFLLQCNYTHIASRYKTRFGEIDLIMQQGDTLVFVEVKYRQKGEAGDGLLAITARKQARFLQACEEYLYQTDWQGHVRIDAIEIIGTQVQHLQNVMGN
ncbi:MAG: YraN family protein [Eubacteriales bacterium]|nr:YraN family protein [Eubacteriales bacterium]